jgi:3-hydroxyisobutyrate dehydrogenase
MSTRIAFLGLGLMGAPMARRLAEAATDLVVWNRSREKTEPFEGMANIAATPAEAAHGADLVCLCLTDAAAVEAVVFGSGGLVEVGGLKRVIDFSSIRPDTTRDIAERLRDRTGAGWIDAPVSGGVPGAEQGTLVIMAGGAVADVEAAKALTAPLYSRFTHMGPVGAGQTTKLANQIIAGCTIAVVAEAVNFAERAGIDAAKLFEALAGGFADSKPFQIFGPRMVARDYEKPLGTNRLMLKDLDTVRDTARGLEAMLPMSATAGELYRSTGAQDLLDADISALIEMFAGSRKT